MSSVGISCLLLSAEPARPVFLYASLAGQPTYDEDRQGGNPFATALIQVLARKPALFSTFTADLIALTRQTSKGAQQAEVVGGAQLSDWKFLPKPRSQTWLALVVVFSSYAHSRIGPSLPGAKCDLQRISDSLSQTGFVVTALADPDREALAKAIKDFESRTVHADVAVIYTTGHGIEVDGGARVLVPYTRLDGSDALPVSELARSARAKHANLIFYAACRTRAR